MSLPPSRAGRPAPVGPGPARTAVSGRRVLVLGLDGLLLDAALTADAPHLQALVATGWSSRTLMPPAAAAPTLSGPGWATTLTGVGPQRHGVRANTWGAAGLAEHPDVLTRVARAGAGLRTGAVVTWAPLLDGSAGPPLITAAVERREVSTGDPDTAARAAAMITADAPHASFVHLDDVDRAGHDHGAASPRYRAAVAALDRHVGVVLAAVAARPAGEAWTVYAVTDHGHTPEGGHGGDGADERASFLLKTGRGVRAGSPPAPAANVDLAVDVLATLGLPLPAHLEGHPFAPAPAAGARPGGGRWQGGGSTVRPR